MTGRPDAQICPFHTDEFLHPVFIGSETTEYEFTCPLTNHPVPGAFSWPWTSEPSGLGSALGLDLSFSLPKAVRDASEAVGGGTVEYGLVERAWALANPDDWTMLLKRFDHRFFRMGMANQQELPYTASRYLAGRLGALGKHGDVLYSSGRGTGYWSFLRNVSYWTPNSVEPAAKVTSWLEAGVAMEDYMPAARPT